MMLKSDNPTICTSSWPIDWVSILDVFLYKFGSYVLKETTMFQVTERADKMIREFQKDKKEIPSIRLKLFRGG